jgi:hypothetical protein
MEYKKLMEKLCACASQVPTHAEVLGLRQHPVDELERRAKSFLSTLGDACSHPMDRGDWITEESRTLIKMPMGARAVLYHASGAMEIHTGLNPMESLFQENIDDKPYLTKLVESVAARSKLREGLSPNNRLEFERLWLIKAAAGDREGKVVRPVLCRAIGAYRQFVGQLPVLGAASVAVKVAVQGQLDSLSYRIRETTGEVIERAELSRPEQAARQVLRQLQALMGKSKGNLDEAAKVQSFQLGYISLSKRQAQRVLAPAYLAAISIAGQERQAYLFAVPATEVAYLPLSFLGTEAPPTRFRKAAPYLRQEVAAD